MLKPQSIPWQEPLELAKHIRQPRWLLLYSGARSVNSGRYSLLACDLEETVESADFQAFAQALSSNQSLFDNAWFGYLGYGLKDSLEKLAADEAAWPFLPDLCMMRFATIYQFDHETQTLTLWSSLTAPYKGELPQAAPFLPAIKNGLTSNMTQAEYMQKAAYIIERIHAGDLYQANLTRKFRGEFSGAPEAVSLFTKLCAVSPAPYSAFVRLDDCYILSSSPESFLQIDASGHVTARPIKGSAPRHSDPADLANSAKDRAENLMIVDLMRNDLARSCQPGSVKVDRLFDVTSHATIHHMSSSISGQKKADATALDVVKSAFPPGSMTGAPKIRAVNLCSELEKQQRGVYSGAIGWFGGDGSCDLSVVIRTLIIRDTAFEFQIGGGIVADSTPQQEHEEILEKARGILACLGLSTADISHI